MSLLDTAPLEELLRDRINFQHLARRLANGQLDAIGVTAASYLTGESVTFYQSDLDGVALMPWQRARRRGVPTELAVEHLLASSAIPMLLPATRIDGVYYGDGALRQLSPISPALHLGARRMMVVGVSGNPTHRPEVPLESHSPSLARMVGQLFNSAFIDALETDVEHMLRINELVGALNNEAPHLDTGDLKQVDFLCINPSIEIDHLVCDHMGNLPRAMRSVLNVVGATPRGGGTSLASYLLFDGDFCRALIDAGYRDALEQQDALEQFFHPDSRVHY